ncbi:PREDICTED: LOW QUALITY PROTEIN: isthmin-1-like [Priapulus caudatus]|uniref:LOW QUALITY PROTEIN: isthmin-1-like n=1 Tax=Priapulus caudatus TaxID=37621 RepID=A0ABM1EEB4_PRICU|nr:PREDICTED: LOW QUALITY PROTEIN: isthmin-1-like [Priapulus caudatus]
MQKININHASVRRRLSNVENSASNLRQTSDGSADLSPNSLRARDPTPEGRHHRRHHHGDHRHHDDVNSTDANGTATYDDASTAAYGNVTSSLSDAADGAANFSLADDQQAAHARAADDDVADGSVADDRPADDGDTILLDLNGGRANADVQRQVAPTSASKVKLIDPHTRENELEKTSGSSSDSSSSDSSGSSSSSSTATARLTAGSTKAFIGLQSGINPDIEVTIEVLHEQRGGAAASTAPLLSPLAPDIYRQTADDDDGDYDYVYDFDDLYPPPGGRDDGPLSLGVERGDDDDDDSTELGVSFEMEAVGSGDIELPVQLYEWSSWSACSVTCGDGVKERERPCGKYCVEKQSSPCRGICEGLVLLFPSLLDLPDDVITARSLPFTMTKVSTVAGKREVYVSVSLAVKYYMKDKSLLVSTAARSRRQHCCYDRLMRLLTRGAAVQGTPNLISREISPELHYRRHHCRGIICRRLTRYNQVRHSNNMNVCTENPDMAEFLRQAEDAQEF